MSQSQMISKLAEYARTAGGLAESEELLAAVKDNKVRQLLSEIASLAKKAEDLATSPVRIGVVGQFNAGKTLLLGAIVGYADALPVSEIPTTGNVTAIRFRQHDEPQTTTFPTFTIEYLDDTTARSFLREMISETRKVARSCGLDETLQAQLERFNTQDTNSLATLESWCATAWSRSQDPDLRTLLHELVWFLRAYFRCGTGVCGTGPYTVTADVVKDGLALPTPRELRSLAFNDLQPAPPAISSPPTALTAAIVKDTFPLIRLLRIEVHVSKTVWDLTGLTGANEFELLDFPGLGSAFSGVRDRYLGINELRNVQTILVMLNADRPGEKAWSGLLDAMRDTHPELKDIVLVGVGRFDRLPLGSDGIECLKQLIDAAEGDTTEASGMDDPFADTPAPAANAAVVPLTEERLLDRLPVLKTSLAAAQQLVPAGRGDRVALLSPLISLNHLHELQPSLRVGSDSYINKMVVDAHDTQKVRQLWQKAASLLEVGKTGRRPEGLATWLSEFAEDGGVARLRKMLASHVQNHGLNTLATDVLRASTTLRDKIKELAGQIGPTAGGAPETRTDQDRLDAAKASFSQLNDFYRRLIESVKRGQTLYVQRDGQNVPITQVISDEAVFSVSEWSQWDDLFQATNDEGYISEEKIDVVLGDDDGEEDPFSTPAEATEDEDSTPDAGFPTRTDDLFTPFEKSLAMLEEFTKNQIDKGLDEWLRTLTSELVGQQQRVGTMLDSPGLVREIKQLKLGKRAENLIPTLKAALRPTELKTAILRMNPNVKKDAERQLDAARLFPLARNTGGNEFGRVFGWAEQLRKHPNPKCRPHPNLSHMSQVLRLQDEIATLLGEEMAQTVSMSLQKLNETLEKVLKMVSTRLALVSGNEEILIKIVNAGTPSQSDQPEDHLAVIRNLANLRWPLAN